MPALSPYAPSHARLREHLAKAGVLLTEATLPAGQLDLDGIEADELASDAFPTPLVASPIVAPTDLRAGDPFSGSAPVLVSQDFRPLDQGGARQVAALQTTGGVVTCLLVHLPTQEAIALLNQLQERGEVDRQVSEGEPVVLPHALDAAEMGPVVGDWNSGPASLSLYGRMPAEQGARVGDLYHTERLGYHQHGFKVDFDNLLNVPAHLVTDDRTPASVVYEAWNEGGDLARAARNVSLNREDYLRQAVIRQARQKGYDGIRYGEEWVQLID